MPAHTARQAPPPRGFALVEAIVSLGLTMIVISLALPMLSGSRRSARSLDSLSRIRQIGLAVTNYADENRGLPPVLFKPEYVHMNTGLQTVETEGITWRGAWFLNSLRYHALLRPSLPVDSLRAPGNPDTTTLTIAGEVSSRTTDYKLADCLYATPAYWDRLTQAGPAQWRPQRLADIRFPSQKGLALQGWAYDAGDHGRMTPTTFDGVKGAVLWSELSTSIQEPAKLAPGVPNFWYHSGEPRPRWGFGVAVDNTQDGILGRDR